MLGDMTVHVIHSFAYIEAQVTSMTYTECIVIGCSHITKSRACSFVEPQILHFINFTL